MIKYLKKSLLIPCFFLMALRMAAQDKQYYIYIQSERSQPFYVRFDGKLLSSSDKGYIIISKLPAGTANMRIGFAKSEVPEQQYMVKVGGPNDQGYLLKQDGLYNIVTFAATRPVKKGEEAAVAVETPAPAPAPVVETPVPAPVETATAPEPQKAMMDSMQKDLAAAFPGKDAGVTVGPGTRPVKPTNKFSESLDRVVKDDRPEEPLVDPNAGTGMILAPAADTAAAKQQPEEKKGRRKRRDREPLTAEEQQILADVMAEEHKAATAPPPATAADVAVTTDTAVAVVTESATAPVATEEAPAPEKKSKKAKKKRADDPAFIDFQDGSNAQAGVTEGTPVPVTSAAEEPAPSPKKKKRRIDAEEHANNVLTDDSSGYAVSDLNIDHSSRKDRKKKKQDVEEGTVAPATSAADVPAVATDETKKSSSVKMINSDCGKVMDDDTFRKLLRKFVGGKDDDGMIDAFKKQAKGYCLETSQVKTLVQLLGTDDSRYRLLDQAYPKVYDSEHFASLESVLSDSYYKGRFKAMVHR
ncbi:DUF4476 domain-containing protein [Chitinophaga sp.]|uniref:DUF4476 domain-containing protein n=1 Tax=Chitinophaga sp. TaxID=1869181 RepID=UPI0031DB2542